MPNWHFGKHRVFWKNIVYFQGTTFSAYLGSSGIVNSGLPQVMTLACSWEIGNIRILNFRFVFIDGYIRQRVRPVASICICFDGDFWELLSTNLLMTDFGLVARTTTSTTLTKNHHLHHIARNETWRCLVSLRKFQPLGDDSLTPWVLLINEMMCRRIS